LRLVTEKTQDQLDLQALHRVRAGLVSRRTATINRIRSFLVELGIVVRAGANSLRVSLPAILKNRTDEISPRMNDIVVGLMDDWAWLDKRVAQVSSEIEQISKTEKECRRLMSDFAAWLGLVPRQFSTGGRTTLGSITKRGSTYLRMLFVQAARVILMRAKLWKNFSFGAWLQQAAARLNRHKLAIALANKLARIAWSVLRHDKAFDADQDAVPAI
jgi:transposase